MNHEGKRGRGPHDHHHDHDHRGPRFGTDDEFHLGARLWYALKLMRRGGGAGRRMGGRRMGGFQGQGRALRLLALQSPITQKELAYLLGIRSQSLAELLGKLEDAGFVERHPNPDDRRTSMVELTDQGRERLAEDEARIEVDPFAVFTDEEKQTFAHLLDRMIEGLEANLPEGPDERMQSFKERTFGSGSAS